MTVPDRTTFESAYAGQPPWDIGRPQKAILDVADQITGSILDAGCGTGENAVFFASRGQKVTGIDFLAEPISRAQKKATERGLTVTFLLMDALTLKDFTEVFDTAIDGGLFDVFNEDDHRHYVEGLATVLKQGGRLFLLCFSNEEPGTQGPRRVSKKELTATFSEGWTIESVEPSRYEVRPEFSDEVVQEVFVAHLTQTTTEIARTYGVTRRLMSAIKHGQQRKPSNSNNHLKGAEEKRTARARDGRHRPPQPSKIGIILANLMNLSFSEDR